MSQDKQLILVRNNIGALLFYLILYTQQSPVTGQVFKHIDAQ